MGVHETRYSLIRIQLDVKEHSAGLERAEDQARQGPGQPIEPELLQGLGARVFHPDCPRAGEEATEADVLMAIVSGNAGDVPRSVELIPVVQEVLRLGKECSQDMLRISALVEEEIRHQGARLAAEAFEIRADRRSAEHTSELQSRQ